MSTNVVTITTFPLEMNRFCCPVAYPIARPWSQKLTVLSRSFTI